MYNEGPGESAHRLRPEPTQAVKSERENFTKAIFKELLNFQPEDQNGILKDLEAMLINEHTTNVENADAELNHKKNILRIFIKE